MLMACQPIIDLVRPINAKRRGSTGRQACSAVIGMAFALTVPPTAGSAPDHTSDAYHLSLFGEVWQTVKDHFFDPGLNGVDWNDAKRRYGPLVAKAGSLEETARLINAMLAELKTSHTHF